MLHAGSIGSFPRKTQDARSEASERSSWWGDIPIES
jgi:hypothetical protein